MGAHEQYALGDIVFCHHNSKWTDEYLICRVVGQSEGQQQAPTTMFPTTHLPILQLGHARPHTHLHACTMTPPPPHTHTHTHTHRRLSRSTIEWTKNSRRRRFRWSGGYASARIRLGVSEGIYCLGVVRVQVYVWVC